MFWGLLLKANKRYSQVVSKPFRVSHATLDVYGGDVTESDYVQVWVHTDDTNHLLCNLNKQTSHALLDVAFSEGETIAFYTKGSGSVHLTGNLIPDDSDFGFGDLGEEEEEDEEVSDEEMELKAKKPTKKQIAVKGKKVTPEEEEEDDDDDDDDVELDESALLDLNGDSDDDDDDDDEDDDEEDDDDEDEDEDDAEQPPQKVAKLDKQKLANGLPNGKGPKEEKNKNKKEEKPVQKPQQQQQKAQNQQQKQQQQQGQKKTLQGGVVVEDLRAGKGPESKHGKKVQVYYEGRLQKNNKVFDSTKGGEGFKFTLGRGEVIRGWDIGVAGMKVGGKRRITCPPGAAYGAKGSPPVIPPNATLIFDVELRGVN